MNKFYECLCEGSSIPHITNNNELINVAPTDVSREWFLGAAEEDRCYAVIRNIHWNVFVSNQWVATYALSLSPLLYSPQLISGIQQLMTDFVRGESPRGPVSFGEMRRMLRRRSQRLQTSLVKTNWLNVLHGCSFSVLSSPCKKYACRFDTINYDTGCMIELMLAECWMFGTSFPIVSIQLM